jgi:hypothetical protein
MPFSLVSLAAIRFFRFYYKKSAPKERKEPEQMRSDERREAFHRARAETYLRRASRHEARAAALGAQRELVATRSPSESMRYSRNHHATASSRYGTTTKTEQEELEHRRNDVVRPRPQTVREQHRAHGALDFFLFLFFWLGFSIFVGVFAPWRVASFLLSSENEERRK